MAVRVSTISLVGSRRVSGSAAPLNAPTCTKSAVTPRRSSRPLRCIGVACGPVRIELAERLQADAVARGRHVVGDVLQVVAVAVELLVAADLKATRAARSSSALAIANSGSLRRRTRPWTLGSPAALLQAVDQGAQLGDAAAAEQAGRRRGRRPGRAGRR
jgi:hypothetical protein